MVEKIIKKLLANQSLSLSQLPNITARTWLIWQLATSTQIEHSGVLLWVEDDKELIGSQQNLLFWQSIYPANVPILIWPEQASVILYNFINHLPQIAIISITTPLQNLPDLCWWQTNLIKLDHHKNYHPNKLVKEIFDFGYERQNKVYATGEFSQRGEIIDIWPITNQYPQRIIWQNNSIASIFSYDLWSQTKITEQENLTILPKKLPTAKTDLAIYLPKNLISFHSQANKIKYKTDWQLLWQNFESLTSEKMNFFTPPHWQLDQKELFNWLQNKKNWKIIISDSRYNFIKEKFSQIKVQNQPFLQGLINQDLKLAILTARELPAQSNSNHLKKFSTGKKTFAPGDYVVHIDHGIGKLAGTIKQNFDQTTKEFFVIHYAANDKLYVPVEKTDRLEKYIGLTRPTLHRLSGNSWQQLKQKIKYDLIQSAEKIIYHQAQREVALVAPFQQSFPEEKSLANDFPFTETADQTRVLAEVWSDLKQDKPMDRLICGDVGFGKTEIALRAAFKIILHGQQVALLCPTTILAQQHFDSFTQRLAKYGVNICLLTRFQDKNEQTAVLAKLARGDCDLVIGTHRLLSDDVNFKKLGLLIIDEEQKFGVNHKEKIKKHRAHTHLLTLSATPIPRTLYFSVAGLKPISLIQTPPIGRQPIISSIEPYDEIKIKQAIVQELSRQGQVYYLFNNISIMPLKVQQLQRLIPTARLAYAHGQMTGKKLSQTMHQFDNQQIDVLVCSTIIENGLDLANVNTLIVEQAANFGLAQLYQLRGRVGRGTRQAYAYFFYSSQKLNGLAAKRLQALEAAYELGSGLELARRDMEIRGIGNLLGHKQHGHIKAVGLNLYLRLLEQAISELQNGQSHYQEDDVHIQLPLTYHIDEQLMPALEQRFDCYQHLAQCQTITELEQLVEKNWGTKELPTPTANLILILKLKIIARTKSIKAIEANPSRNGEQKITIFFQQPLTESNINILKKLNNDWQINNKTSKIKISSLGKDWINHLIKTIEKI